MLALKVSFLRNLYRLYIESTSKPSNPFEILIKVMCGKKIDISVRTPKWPPRLIFAGA